MSNLGSIGSSSAVSGAQQYRRLAGADSQIPLGGSTPRPTRASDRVEISEIARDLAARIDDPAVRSDLVDRVRAEIAAGTYDTDENLSAAIDGLIDDLRLDA
ncbi:MAG: flagellar biosynthesis anti-sigma factor FlgM [Planctomycetota bacterium]